MAIIVRITSADGKKVIAKVLPALPAHIKVPAGAHVDVIDKDSGQRMSLGQYINAHSGDDRGAKDGQPGHDQVTVETVQEWSVAEDWLNTMAQQPTTEYAADASTASAAPATDQWYATDANKHEGQIMGYSKDTLIIGGLVGGGLAVGAFALSSGGGGGTKDTIGPAAPTGLALAAADDTGTSTTDGITKNTTGLTITGNAESGSKVEVFDGVKSLGFATASATGTFSLDADLAEGSHAITAIAQDQAGNIGKLSGTFTLVVDTTPPAAPTALALAAADDTGSSSTDGITTKGEGLTVTGTASANGVVELFDGATSLGKITAGTDGKFSIDIALDEGVHTVTAKTTDAAGNLSDASGAITINVDNTAPLPPSLLDLAADDDNGASNSDNITSKTTNLTISGTTEAGARVELFDGSTSVGTFFAGADGSFAKDINLAIGDHAITAKVTDLAGNTTTGTNALEIHIVAPDSAALLSSTSHFG
ncbi:Ig-like domain-containing protein [Novosphingobium album (ex Liu et al. 2023)]|uniref:Ig-like domain-containing protein n=1 Tax=Novosphingobium album (ex Liu et al. 2023) TaxID=3031130 RepID=A0ABT5WKH9_9SPHN|nr:Ig-like domain-containing protein [Novosphingobium album (ex Liu et al. 2023)]MDE8650216.1 Ig-like domain-containing protein [Novosphingobium album (ex Liu et al. 2023)]